MRTGRRLGKHTTERVLSEEVIPLKLSRLFERYHETEDDRERAAARWWRCTWTVVEREGDRLLPQSEQDDRLPRHRKMAKGGRAAGPYTDRPAGRPKGVRKMDLVTLNDIRRMQENPELGAFCIHAALEQKKSIKISVRSVGRVMAVHRNLYGLGRPKRSLYQKKREMPFRANRRHEIWTADVRYIDYNLPPTELEGNAYVIAVLENHSRAILANCVSGSQDTSAFLRVLYSAVERYGSPERLVTDGGAIFRAKQALSIYEALNIAKEEIDRGQSYIETTFNM